MSNNINACEVFLEMIVITHILAAFMAVLGMETLDDNPSSTLFSEEEATKKIVILEAIIKVVVNVAFTTSAR
jgi:hypothetical protein